MQHTDAGGMVLANLVVCDYFSEVLQYTKIHLKWEAKATKIETIKIVSFYHLNIQKYGSQKVAFASIWMSICAYLFGF